MPEEATLVYAIPGQGYLDLLDRFSDSIQTNPETSWLILPTDTLVRHARIHFSDWTHPPVPDQICTPDELCRSLLSVYGEGITCISDSDARLLLSRVIVDHSADLSLFMGASSPSGRMLADLHRLFSYIVRYELTYPDCLDHLQTRKSEQIGIILNSFSCRLERLGQVTRDTLIERVVGCLKKRSSAEPLVLYSHIFWLGQYNPAPLEKRLIQACAERIDHMVYVAPLGEDTHIFPHDASWVFPGKSCESRTIPANEREKAITSLFSDDFPEKKADLLRETISLTEWKDPVSELSGIAREILLLTRQNIPWEDIAVVFPDANGALSYLADVFDDYHIPYHCTSPPFLSASPLVSFFLLLGECVEKGMRYDELIRLVRSPYLQFRWEPAAEIPGGSACTPVLLDYASLDLICRSYGIIGGYIDWDARFAQIIGYITGETTSDDTRPGEKGVAPNIPKRPLPRETILLTIEGALRLIDLLRTLLARNSVSGHGETFRTVLRELGSPVPGTDGSGEGVVLTEDEQKALEEFDQVLFDLTQQPDTANEILSFPEFFSRLRLILMDRNIRPDEHTGVFVAGISDIEQIQVPYLFLASLNEGLIPRLNYRLPFINGTESGKIGDDLHAHLKRERYRFICAVMAGSCHVYLSSFEHRDERTALSSSFLGPFYQSGLFPTWGAGAPVLDPDLFSDSENAWYSGTLMACSRWDEALAFLPETERLSDIVARVGIERNFRFRLNRSEYDGIIGDGPVIRTEMEERFGPLYSWSASLLETYARCPYRFYLEHVLHIRPLTLLGTDLSPDAKGRLIHSVICRYKRGVHERDGFPLRAEHYHDAVSTILEIAGEELDAVLYDTPVWLAKRRQLMGGERYGAGVFEKFIAAEIARLSPDDEGNEPAHFVPRHFEFSFGAVPEMGDDPASVSDPVDLAAMARRRLENAIDSPWVADDIPDRLLLCGKIDRIDITSNGDFGVVDYKTGIKIPSTTEISSGKALQLPLYLMAFADITGNNPVYGSYCHLHRSVTHAISLYHPGYRTTLPRGKMPRSESKWEHIMDITLFHTCLHVMDIHRGVFPIHADRGCNPDWFCPYKTICRFQPDRGSHLGEWIRYPEGSGHAVDRYLTGDDA